LCLKRIGVYQYLEVRIANDSFDPGERVYRGLGGNVLGDKSPPGVFR
jgi:hypothetical protein